MTAIYNELDGFAAQWLRNLIVEGHIAPGAVDERSIANLAPADVAGPGQRHFFAGIGGWSYALRLAGVPDDADVWTGSCPCQPFSAAGRGLGTSDPRHLWPEWFRLIRERRPATIFGEQVASPAGLAWLDVVFADLEGEGYACAAADLCAASVGAPHIRQRLYFVAYAGGERRQGFRIQLRGRRSGPDMPQADWSGSSRTLAYASRSRLEIEREQQARGQLKASERGGPAVDWSVCDWLPCSDEKQRPVEPGAFPLVARLPGRVGLLRGYGNSIVPQVAAEFICAALGDSP